jgi:hypothetical protein
MIYTQIYKPWNNFPEDLGQHKSQNEESPECIFFPNLGFYSWVIHFGRRRHLTAGLKRL